MSDDSTPMPLEHGDERFDRIEKQLKSGQARMAAIEIGLAENTTTTNRIDKSTAGMVEWMNNFEGAFKVLEGIGKLAKPLAIIAAAIITVSSAVTLTWLAIKGWTGIK